MSSGCAMNRALTAKLKYHYLSSMKGLSFYLVGIVFMLSSACSGKKAQYIADLDQLKQTSDSITFDLNKIEIKELRTLLGQADGGLRLIKESLSDDTLDLEFARMLEKYGMAYYDLMTLEGEIEVCELNSKLRSKRLRLLKADIENDLGDRVDYEKNIKTETRELTKIRNHSIELKRRFEEAKSAIEQFQPELERYLTQNVPSTP